MTDVKRSTVTITVNGRAIEAATGELLIEVAERAGTYVPRFCYHPRMEPVGICRMCLVEVDSPRGATLQPACYLKVNDGMNVVTDSEKVKKAQDGVLEFLLANHPLDCPVCDKGGECPLQDQTLSHGSGETRFIEEKRHFVKPVEIGPLILLDRERCIQCARCTRFAADVAGDAQIAFAGRAEYVEVATSPTQPFDSVFSGNTVQICPVGALTAKPYRFNARPWDLEQVESTCTTCAVGCRVAVQSSGNRLTRVLGVDSEPVNHGWLCDKGRFTIESIDANEGSSDPLNPATRITEPLVRRDGALVAVGWGDALAEAASLLRRASSTPDGLGAIGGAALTNEGAFAWERVLRRVLRTDHVDAQYGDGLDAALLQALPRATIDEATRARVVVTLSGDLREELPILFLRLRERVTRYQRPIVELAFGASALRSVAEISLPVRPGEAHLVARALQDGVLPHGVVFNEDELNEARALIGDSGEGVVFVVGRPNIAESSEVIEHAIRLLATQFPRATFLPALRRANVMGSLDMGLGPRLRPGRGFDAGSTGRDTLAQLEALRSGEQSALLMLGGCLLGNVLDVSGAREALDMADVVVVTGHGGASLAYADVVLPAAVQHERLGTVTNIESRVTTVTPKIVPPGSAWPDVAIASELAEELGQSLGLSSVEQTAKTIEETTGYPALSVLNDSTSDGVIASDVAARSVRRPLDPMAFPGIQSTEALGLAAHAGSTALVDLTTTTSTSPATLNDLPASDKIDVPLADAYSLRVNLSRRLFDNGVAIQGSPSLAALKAVCVLHLNHFDLDRLGAVSGDVVGVTGSRALIRLPVALDDSVPRGVVEIAFGSLDATGRDVVRPIFDGGDVIAQVRLEST
ncbi:MAG TPA: NADH-quinone oxidoreductase subunit NuoG [Acidimicrobiales bacterium]|nr:NADH-quinone oxidoreductase subunit NuoG [Acidimicrobiales bacterium]